MNRGERGYAGYLDRANDGVGCEQLSNYVRQACARSAPVRTQAPLRAAICPPAAQARPPQMDARNLRM